MFMRMERKVFGTIPLVHAEKPSSRLMRNKAWMELR